MNQLYNILLSLYFNSRLGLERLKYLYSVISVIDNFLPGNTKKLGIARFVDDESAICGMLSGMRRRLTCMLSGMRLTCKTPHKPMAMHFVRGRTSHNRWVSTCQCVTSCHLVTSVVTTRKSVALLLLSPYPNAVCNLICLD